MKHKLKIEELSVDTFVVSAEPAGERGTVRAFAKRTEQTCAQFTCLVDDCQPTFGNSCIQTQCPVQLTINEFTCLVDDCQPTFVYSCGAEPELCTR